MLPSLPPDKVNAKYYKDTVKYFKNAMYFVESIKDPHSRLILKEALADTIGGHMTKEILPNARFAYYAGYIPYRSARDLHNFYESLKLTLNTQGFGWKRSTRVPLQSNLTVGKILIGAGKPFDPCSSLVVKRDKRDCIQIPSPSVDNEARPAAISLPFKSGGLVSLNSPRSENVLLKYYTTAARCILRRSPQECRHGDFVNFNNELWHWMKKFVAPHLMDENLYAGYGGVLRIAAAVQNYGKGLSRRNLYEDFEQDSTNMFSNSFLNRKITFNFGTDSTPISCAYLVLLAAAMICFLHVCYTWICGPAGGCNCAGRRNPRNKDIKDNKDFNDFVLNYANVEMENPSNANRCSEIAAKRPSFIKQRSTSVVTTRTQKVYDLNENKEKVMSIVMSDQEHSETETSSSEDGLVVSQRTPTRRSPGAQQRSPRSPPKIEATVAHLKIERTPQKTPVGGTNTPAYTTSNFTHSDRSRRVHGSESWSDSYSSENTGSSLSRSETPKSRSKRSHSIARRTPTSQYNKTISTTEFDQSSVATAVNRIK
ncbi:hypothetical protein NE865_11429 [Phthorimaea operculella]|nr:hypothetical protein NE865_11429 [Phthorimaea operculella]